ncbi:MAG: toll/interleukin-1 receptor domain-containing protein [Bacteroides graminisolvens]|uniref:toll/interleukin-1 receptor domain-containing protein n=1 Tax=Bacteroides graminisolvens TaxID=477666 RepID=UPI003A875B01
MGKENTIYKEYAKYIFSYFENCNAPGQGLFLFRSIEAVARKERRTQTEINHIRLVVYNLYENGYFVMPNEPMPFVKLTEKGFNYIQGDNLISNSIQLENYIDLSKNDIDSIFRQLWDIIGKQGEAPFYIDGSTYFNAIYPYAKNLSGNYSTFMDNLRDKDQSTSRIVWFKELLKGIDRTDIPNFLHDLSIAIGKLYEEIPKDEDSDWDELFNSPVILDNKKETASNPKEVIKEIKITPMKKNVFITYCWEDDAHTSWVHHLSEDLEKAGFNIIIDVKQPLGIELNKFMEQTIIDADKILIIATPEYKDRADNRKYGVGYETSLVTADLIKDQNRIKFIPIIRKGSKDECYPNYLGNRKGLPMTEKDDYAKALNELIQNIANY